MLLAVSASPALAQRGPYIVIPGRPMVPIFENGVDVLSWSVVEGEYGLDRPNIVNPVVIYRMPPVVVPYPGRAALGPAYFPRDGMTPGYGRLDDRRRRTAHCRGQPKATAARGGWSSSPRPPTFRRTIRTPSRP